MMIEVTVMEKAMQSSVFAVLKGLLEKAFRGTVSTEMTQLVENYIDDACDKMKRIIEALN